MHEHPEEEQGNQHEHIAEIAGHEVLGLGTGNLAAELGEQMRGKTELSCNERKRGL